jgi:hypothetical protein
MTEKFLFLDVRDDDRTFVFHTERPRFLIEFLSGGEGDFFPIDSIPEADRSALRQEAREFYEEG